MSITVYSSMYHQSDHSCMPSPLAPDPIRVQSHVFGVFSEQKKLYSGNIYLSIYLINQSEINP